MSAEDVITFGIIPLTGLCVLGWLRVATWREVAKQRMAALDAARGDVSDLRARSLMTRHVQVLFHDRAPTDADQIAPGVWIDHVAGMVYVPTSDTGWHGTLMEGLDAIDIMAQPEGGYRINVEWSEGGEATSGYVEPAEPSEFASAVDRVLDTARASGLYVEDTRGNRSYLDDPPPRERPRPVQPVAKTRDPKRALDLDP